MSKIWVHRELAPKGAGYSPRFHQIMTAPPIEEPVAKNTRTLAERGIRFLSTLCFAMMVTVVIGIFAAKPEIPSVIRSQFDSILSFTRGPADKLELLKQLSAETKKDMAGQVHYISELIRSAKTSPANSERLALSIVAESRRANFDPLLAAAIIKSESTFRTHAVSYAGAKGLMQIMPDTGTYIAAKAKLGSGELHDTAYNLRLGIAYFKHLKEMYRGDVRKALVAYNWGPANLAEALKNKKQIPSSSIKYAQTIMSTHRRWRGDYTMRVAQYRYLNIDHLIS